MFVGGGVLDAPRGPTGAYGMRPYFSFFIMYAIMFSLDLKGFIYALP